MDSFRQRTSVISSGCPVAEDIETDVLNADRYGKEAKEKLMMQCTYKETDEEKDFFDKIAQLKLKSLSDTNKIIKMKSKDGKLIQYQEQASVTLSILVKS